jgi:hypothetical protein
MEHTNEIKQEDKKSRSLAINVAFIFSIFLICFIMIIAIIVLIKNVEEIKKDPIIYGMEKVGYDMCGCSGENVEGNIYTLADYNELNYVVINGSG